MIIIICFLTHLPKRKLSHNKTSKLSRIFNLFSHSTPVITIKCRLEKGFCWNLCQRKTSFECQNEGGKLSNFARHHYKLRNILPQPESIQFIFQSLIHSGSAESCDSISLVRNRMKNFRFNRRFKKVTRANFYLPQNDKKFPLLGDIFDWIEENLLIFYSVQQYWMRLY
jgi:hypothetical protein